ncbi:uncharacterized protein F4807DRAFT_421074 [Annulohypoxylon truncatum]|uniref:uncharacterized protein n=1 Tax=Annulohypoxylon truncatum TaxID=327061 RepID=UPI0020082A39|nr:uncharacterized protein F4807DRAFT_421074 [Annulohypoxylon truncatum]KAI1210967.1 hypothetical protein F4807DRAFT_421074 [Annulohypoxylon truncatum]
MRHCTIAPFRWMLNSLIACSAGVSHLHVYCGIIGASKRRRQLGRLRSACPSRISMQLVSKREEKRNHTPATGGSRCSKSPNEPFHRVET